MSIKKENVTFFNRAKEEAQNPFIGVMSFQHYRGEKLYSDCIVKPENNFTETEHFECYPIPEYVEENGREEGYYPDNSVCYFRFLWKDFEPERGKYNYKFIEDIIEGAKAHNQTLIIRLMAHATRERDDVPEWLKTLIPCPERPDGMRVKDSPTDPLFIELFLEAVKKLGERFDSEPVLDAIDISLPGAWGEGHNLHLYPDDLLNKIVDVYTDVFKETILIGQLGKAELLHYAKEKTKIGWRGDGLGEPRFIHGSYPERIAKVPDFWKEGPVSFESYWWLGEWKRHGWGIDEIIEKTLEWHISSFNPKSLPIPFEMKDKVEEWISKMGYHFAPVSFKYPENCSAGETIELEFNGENIGVAPIYRKIPFKVRLTSENNSYEFDTDVDITKWLPGEFREKFAITLPSGIEKGEYDIEIGMYNELISVIYLSTDAKRNGSFYKAGKINII